MYGFTGFRATARWLGANSEDGRSSRLVMPAAIEPLHDVPKSLSLALP